MLRYTVWQFQTNVIIQSLICDLLDACDLAPNACVSDSHKVGSDTDKRICVTHARNTAGLEAVYQVCLQAQILEHYFSITSTMRPAASRCSSDTLLVPQ
jgi:hypothetical protein